MKLDFTTAAVKRSLAQALIPAVQPTDPAMFAAWQFSRLMIDHMAAGQQPLQREITNGIVTQRRYKVALEGPLYTEVAKNVTLGFELETQATNGIRHADVNRLCDEWNRGRPLDEAAYTEAVERRANELMATTDFYQHNNAMLSAAMKPYWQKLLYDAYVERNQKESPDDVAEATNEENKALFMKNTADMDAAKLMEMAIFLHQRVIVIADIAASVGQEAMTRIKEAARTTASAQTNRNNFLVGGRLDDQSFRQRRVLPNDVPGRELLDVGTDGSVSGFEIRTIGALTIPNFMRAINAVFAPGVTHAVDAGCSFHLHVGLSSGKLPYSAKVQAAMYEYLLMNIQKVPAKVRARWANLARGDNRIANYFRLQLRFDKYSFIHCHGQGTWEFRCFGNVDNKKDAIDCLRLALGAIRYAGQVASGMRELSCLPSVGNSQGQLPPSTHSLCIESITKNIPLDRLTVDRKMAAKKLKERA